MLKKISIYLLLSLLFSVTHAQKSIQVQTIQHMYEQGRQQQKGMDLIIKQSELSLKKAFKLHDQSDDVCGYDQDIMWQSQDPNFNRPFQITALGQNRVKVHFAKTASDASQEVIYTLKCTNRICQISDVHDQFGSLKENITQECR
jgi:hypothetical protein